MDQITYCVLKAVSRCGLGAESGTPWPTGFEGTVLTPQAIDNAGKHGHDLF
jgi:hypothetical protein